MGGPPQLGLACRRGPPLPPEHVADALTGANAPTQGRRLAGRLSGHSGKVCAAHLRPRAASRPHRSHWERPHLRAFAPAPPTTRALPLRSSLPLPDPTRHPFVRKALPGPGPSPLALTAITQSQPSSMVLFASLPFPLWSGSCLPQPRACLAPPATSPVPSTERARGGLYGRCWTTNTVNSCGRRTPVPPPPEGCPDCSDQAAACPAQLSPHLSRTQAPLVSPPPQRSWERVWP